MIETAAIAVGVGLIAISVIDMVWTVVAVGEGAGPVSGPAASGLWRAVLWAHRRAIESPIWLRLGGVFVVLSVLVGWILTVWLGWWLVLVEGSVVDAVSGEPADAWGRAYFAGYTLFTMGNGELVPAGSAWQMATAVANLAGLVLVTLGVTYLVPVARAATRKRSLATTISALGGTPQQIVLNMWDGADFDAFRNHAGTLINEMSEVAQMHLAYPVLHYFHSVSGREALPPRLAALDDALTVMAEGVSPDVRLPPGVIEPVRESLMMFLETLRSAYIAPDTDEPPVIDPELLRSRGVPVVGADSLRQIFEHNSHRRRLAAAFVHHDGWSWHDSVMRGREVIEESNDSVPAS